MQAPFPPEELEPITAAQCFETLDTATDREFDDIALLAAHICGTPTATISLIDENRQWFKSGAATTANGASHDNAFREHEIFQGEVFVVNDAQADGRFASNPRVNGDAMIRFYAGARLITTDGRTLGMLCVNDRVPRGLSQEQRNALRALSRQSVALLELRRNATELQRSLAQLTRAESLVRKSEERYRSLFDNARDAIFTIATDGTFTSMNAAVEPLGGISRAEWIGKSFAPMVHPDDLPLALEMFGRTLRGEQVPVHELRGNPNLGQPALMEMTLVAQTDEAGKIIGVLGIGRDITERKKAEQAMQRLRNQHALILNSVGEGVHGLDLDGRIIFENPAAAALLGFQITELIGRAAHATMHHTRADGTPYPQEECPIHATLKDGVVRHVRDEIFWRKDGTSFPVEYTSAPLRDEEGRIIGVTVVFTDVTSAKRLQARLFQSQKMETVGKLAGGIAHEFNSILTAIIGQSELLLRDLPARSPLAGNANEINQAAGRAATLTRQLLAYGRKQFLHPEILDLNHVVAGMAGVFRLLMGADVNMQIAAGAGLHAVKADAGQIEQVIMNLVINAREAMPNGGRLTVETANVSIDEESVGRYPELKAGDYVMLAITDTGAGMSEEVQARLFEPFFSTKAIGQGTGLGLSTCYGIVKQSGGHISVYSEPGRGTTFKIYLPQVQESARPPVQRIASTELPRGTETILLVEDDPALREMSSTLLRRLGYTVWVAANGVEALTLKQQRNVGHIDLLFTDVVMPQMSGKELADRMEALYPHMRILFTSAYTENAILHQGMLNKGVTLLQKPFTPSALANKLREVLGRAKTTGD